MQSHETHEAVAPKHTAWNRGKLIGPKPPPRAKHVWAIRTKLQLESRIRDLAMFNLASTASCAARCGQPEGRGHCSARPRS